MIIVLIIIHFGKNPVRGGRPAKDISKIDAVIDTGRYISMLGNWLDRVEFILLNKINSGVIINVYKVK